MIVIARPPFVVGHHPAGLGENRHDRGQPHHVRQSSAVGQLYRSSDCGGYRCSRRPGRERLQDRRGARGAAQPAFLLYGSDIKLQTRYILENLKRTFEAAGSSLEKVVKAQVFLTDLNDFAGFDEVWKEYFVVPPPRTTVGTSGLLIEDALIEIDLIGYTPELGFHQSATSDNPKPLANYSEAIRIGGLVFAAGQLASDFKTGVAPEARRNSAFPFYGSDIKLQTRYILENLKRTFAAAGTSLENVVKAQVFLTDLNDFAGFDEVWKEYFAVPPPCTTVGTTGLLIKDTLIEIDLIASLPVEGWKHDVVSSANPKPLANYSEAIADRDLCIRGRPARNRFQDRRARGGAQAPIVPLLRFGHQAADPLYPPKI